MKHCLFNDTGDLALDLFNDTLFICNYINCFLKAMGVKKPVSISITGINQIARAMREQFPYEDGNYKNASPFKKAAYFVALFVEVKPIKSILPQSEIGTAMHQLKNHQNAIPALVIALYCLHNAKIEKTGETLHAVTALTIHSFMDIVNAIASAELKDWLLLSVLFEQISYKTNGHCQYPDFVTLWHHDYDTQPQVARTAYETQD